MKPLLPILKTKLFLVSFLFTSTLIIATTITLEIKNSTKGVIAEKAEIKKEKKKTAKKISPGQRTASSVSWSPTLTSDAADYAPGTTAKLTGTGFLPNETVRVQVLHANYVEGDPIGEDHEPWYVTANENGNFETTWHVCEDDCVGQTLRATADGQDPAGPVRHAEVLFTDSNPPLEPDLIITSLSSSGPFCRGSVFTIYFTTGNNGDVYNAGNVFTAQLGNGGGNWPNSPDILGTLTLSGTSPLTGQITATIPLDYNGVGSSHNIRIVASNPDVEGADYGTEILIGSPPNDYNVTGGGAFCPDNATGLNVGLQDSQEPFTDNNKTYNFTYQLYLNGSPIGSPLIGTGSALDFGIQSFAGTYSVIATNGETGCTAPMKNTVTISSSLVAPGLTKSPDVSSVCAGAMLTVTTTPGSGGTGATDQYRYNDGSGFTAWGTTVPSFPAVIGTNTIESRRIASGAGCNTSASNTVSWTVLPEQSAGAASATPTVCINIALSNITHTTTGATGISGDGVSGANGLPAGVSATWASDLITISGTPTASGTFNYSIPLTGGCGTANATGTITVLPAFTTGAIMTTNETICYGGNPAVIGNATVASGGDGNITYSWRSSADGYTAAIGGATSSTFTPPAGLTVTTSYRRYAEDGTCTPSPTQSTGTWTVTVYNQFTPGAISTTNETICYGTSATVQIGSATDASGGDGNITYSWRSSEDGFTAAIPGATSSTYTPTGVLTTSTSYRRYAKDGTCNTTTTQSTGEWTVTVRPLFTTGAILTTNETICYGGNAGVIGSATDASGGDGNITYSWRSSADGYTAAIAGATSSTFTPPAGLTATTSYRRYAKEGTCNTSPTQSAGTWTVTVRPQFTPGAIQTTNETICYGSTATMQIGSATDASGGDGTITYSWRSSEDGFTAAIPGATSSTYTPTGVLTTTTSYRRYAKDGTCNTSPTQSTGTWIVTVYDPISNGTLTGGDQTFCAGSNDPSNITFSTLPSGGAGTFSYQWYYKDGINTCPGGTDVTGWTLIPSATSSSYDPPSPVSATRTYAVMVDATGSPDCGVATWASGCRKVTVLAAVNFGTVTSGDESFCAGSNDPSNITLSTPASGGAGTFTYQWYYKDGINTCPSGTDATGWTSILYATGSSYDPPPGLTASRTYAIMVNPTGTPDCGVATWASGCRKVTVLTAVNNGTLTSGDETFCAGSNDPSNITFSTLPTGGTGTFTYKWYYKDGINACPTGTDATGWTCISGETGNSYDPSAGLTSSRTYAVMVDATGSPDCSPATWASGCRKVTVLAAVNFGTLTSGDETICPGDPSNITFSTAPVGGAGTFSYQWYYKDGINTCPSGTDATGWTIISGANSSNYDPPTGLIASRTYAVMVDATGSPDCGAATWASGCRKVTVLKATTVLITSDKAPLNTWTYGCETATFTATADGQGTLTYQWWHKYNGGTAEMVGANSSTYQVPGLAPAGTHEYWVVVSAYCGNKESNHITVTINPQPADAANEGEPYYTGPAAAFTANSTSNTATFTMSAFVKNKDGSCGDIATARVSFWYRISSGGTGPWTKVPNGQNLPVNYVDPANPSSGGAAAVIAQLNIGNGTCETFDVLVTLSGNYTGNGQYEQSQVFISKPQPGGTISGGAKISNVNSIGFVKGVYKSEISFFVNYTVKQGKAQNPKGKVNLTVKSKYDRFGNLTTATHLYKITSNAIASLVVGQPTPEKATFTSKANIAEIINSETGEIVPMEGNCTMVMDLVDLSACDNNTLDKIGIVVYRNSGGIWYANNFNISNGTTSPMAILSGCVWVSTSGLTSCIPAPVINNSLTRSTQMEIKPPGQLNVKVYPNPSEHHFTLYLEGANNEKVAIVVYDAIGRQVKKIERGDASGAIKFGEDLKVGVYIVEVRQGDNRKTLKLVKQ